MLQTGVTELEQLAQSLIGRMFVRREDRVLILPPNQVYSLNDSALRVLEFLQQGGKLKTIIDQYPDEAPVFSDLQQLFAGIQQLLDGRGNPAAAPGVEMQTFRKEFYVYPVLAEFAVTYRCNLRCRFCYLPSEKEVKQELTTGQAKKIIDKLATEARVPFVSFTGGEPLLRRDLDALIAHACQQGLKVNLISNGTLITRRRASELRKAGLTSAQISLESPEKAVNNALTRSDSFDRTVAGITHLLESGIYVHTNTTISRENMDTLVQLPAFLKRLGTRKFSANLIIPVGRAGANKDLWIPYSSIGDIIEKLRSSAKKADIEFVWYSPLPYCIYNPAARGLGATSCAACHGLVHVNPYGFVLPCSSDSRPVGNWLKQSFKEIWFSARAVDMRKMEYLPAVCRSCEHREICAGACPLYWERVGDEEIAG